jgi:four helix bundle protein
MASLKCFEDLEVWQKSREFAKQIYAISRESHLSRDFILRDQIIRSAVSIISNIAEGFERGGTGEFIQFLSVAKGSAGELRSQLYIVLDQGYIDESKFKELFEMNNAISRMISRLIEYLRKSNIKGIKYKQPVT